MSKKLSRKKQPYGSKRRYLNPEPVPPASQLAVLPFLAAVDGFLRDEGDVPRLRITIHRAMSREGNGYLQQVCGYLQEDGADWHGKVGRIFPVDEGIMGAAFENGRIWRTKLYLTRDELRTDLRSSLAPGDQRDPEEVVVSYLAVPFLGPQNQVVLILYAECDELNFFANNDRVQHVVAMCRGFCRLFDWLQKDPFSNLQNFPLQKGEPITGSDRTVYGMIQEALDIDPPRFNDVPSFNYEASAA
jgi:hypothetical protein